MSPTGNLSSHFTQGRVWLNLNVTRKLILMLLLAAVGTIPLWLGLQRVRSAPSALPPPASPPSPVVTIDLPDQILIGEDFTFDVEFKNTPGSDVGFGTYVALYLPARGADGNLGGHKCDGIRFKSAEALFTTPATLPLVPAYNSSLDTATNNLNCPLAYTLPFPGMTLAPTPAGDYQLVVLELPLGSFQSTQPGIKVRVKANLSDYADQVTSTAGTPLTVYAVGGFRYGADALNNHPSDPLIETALVSDQTKPTVLKLKKAANAPEDETATGPNFLRKYTVTADIADGQKIDNLKIHDFLDNNVQYQGQVIVKIGATTAIAGASCGSGIDYVITKQPPTSAPQNPPNNELEILFCHSITGTAAATDVTITFAFFIPERDANTATVLPTNCKPATSTNDVKAEGDWTPADPRDQPMFQITSDLTLQDHVLADKCIAIQKSVAMAIDTGAPGLTPGDTLQYTLKFQGSDYKTFGSLVVSDMLSNGQILASPVTLTVSDQFGTKSGVMPPMFVTQAADPLGASKFCPATLQTPPNGTVLTFKISLAMAAIPGFLAPRLNAGILTGGYAAGIPPPHNPAVGTITFRAKVLDDFQYAVSPGDKFVDKEDPMNNCVAIDAKVLQNVNRPNPINLPTNIPNVVIAGAHDNSATALLLIGDTLKKTVYSVKRPNAFGIFNPVCGPPSGPGGTTCSNFPNAPQQVQAGDQVTYRIEKILPSSDAENLSIDDWLPVPTYTVSSINFANSACGVPGPANACLGPSDTLHSLPVSPNVTSNSTTNSINFNYGTFNNVANQPLKIDLLFTYAVTNLPFADGLFLTNEVQECETDTFGQPFCQVSIAQVNLREPRLVIRKAAVATDNPNGVFTPAPPPPGIFNLGGFLSGPINSANVGLINSNLTNVDANDLVTFAITIENLGGAPAYHVKVEDVIPNVLGTATCFTIVPNSFQVKRGTGAIVNPLLYTLVFPTSNGGFTITSNPLPIPINAHHPTNGTNIVVITFQAKLLGNVMPGCYDNTAEIKHYSSQLNGPDFVSNNLTPPFVDLAQVCVEPTLTKSVVATSEVHTAPQVSIVPQTPGNTPRLTIGEIARYRLVVQLPETGTLANVKITDALPGGMKFLRDNTARMAFVANGFGITHPSFGLPLGPPYNVVGNETTLPTLTLNAAQTIPNPFITVGTSCGDDPTFDLGNIKNNNLDTDLEFIVIEFNAQVCNSAGNVQGTMLPNTFSLVFNNATIATSPPINVRVFEPNLSIAKAASATTVAQGGTVAYTVTITNTGPLQAFDVQFTDTMAAGLTFVPNSTTVTGGCVLAGINSTSPAVTCSSVATGGVVTIKYNAIANPTSCPATLTNQAAVTWTSLPGPKGTAINPTLSNPTVVLGASGANGATDGERDGVTPSLAINNYAAAASRSVTVNCPPCVQPPHLMSAWWPFDEANGATVVNDFAGVNNQGMPKPGSPVGAPNSPSSVAGRVSGALKFDSAGSSTGPNIEVPNHPEINFGSSDFSIDAWVLVPQPPAVYIHPIVDKLQVNSAGTAGTGYALNLVSSFTNGARLEFLMGTGGSLAGYGPNAPWVPFNTWTHVTVTVNRGSGVVTFYINGTPLSAGGPPIPAGSLDNTLPLLIGESRLVGLGQQSITIDELELFKRVLPQPEIQGLVTAGGGGKCKCLNTSNETITCGANGTFNYTFTITNLSSSTMTAVNFGAGGGLTITPSSMTIPPLAPGASTNVTVVIGGPAAIAGANVCFSVGLVGGPPPSQGCRVQHCITLPACSTTGSLTVTKTISTPQPPPVLTPPSTAVFPVTVACQPSGYNQALSLTPSLLTQTFSNIPIGDTCTVTEGPLPAPFGNPVCAALGWAPPVYSPAQTVTISAASQTVSISNRFSCSTCAPPPPGMVGWWPMNVQSNQVNDIAPAPGSLFNNVGTAPAYQPVNGYVGGLGFGALYFNTLPASIVSVPSHPELNFVNGDFSIDAWVSVISGSGAIHPIVDKFNSPGGPGFAFYVRSGRLELNINGTTFVSTGPLMTPAANPQGNSGPWYHIAVSVQRNPAQVTFYLNGGQVGTYSPTNIGPVVNNLPLWIGGTRIAGNKLELSIDELELFNRVLNQTEIQQIFSAGAAGKCRQGIP